MIYNRKSLPNYSIRMKQKDALINPLVKLEAIADLISELDPADARKPKEMETLMWDLAKEFRMAIDNLPIISIKLSKNKF
jgi:hypothetical protein